MRDFTLRGKRLQVICLVLLLAVLAGAAFLFYRENRVAAVVTLEPFNFRSGPDAGSALLGESEAGGVYPVLERRSGGGTIYGKRWFKVRLDGGGEAYLVDASNSSQQQLN
ncbi:MAG: SH3 domain-containing protein, partial [Clostridiaceae bacterium]|nr:SH3 domain-containing protein [Clostridiaceae bacterium]